MCNLYSITTNQGAIIRLFRVLIAMLANLPPMPGVFPDYPAPVVRNVGTDREMVVISPVTFDSLMGAPSIGQFFNQNIKGSGSDGPYDCRTHRNPKY